MRQCFVFSFWKLKSRLCYNPALLVYINRCIDSCIPDICALDKIVRSYEYLPDMCPRKNWPRPISLIWPCDLYLFLRFCVRLIVRYSNFRCTKQGQNNQSIVKISETNNLTVKDSLVELWSHWFQEQKCRKFTSRVGQTVSEVWLDKKVWLNWYFCRFQTES